MAEIVSQFYLADLLQIDFTVLHFVFYVVPSIEEARATPASDTFGVEALQIAGMRKDVFPDADSWRTLMEFFSAHKPLSQEVGFFFISGSYGLTQTN